MMSKKDIDILKKDLKEKFVIDSLMQKGNITYEKLQPFSPNYDFIQLTQKMKEILGKNPQKKHSKITNVEQEQKKPIDWTMQLAVINYLRRLFKFEKDIFNETFYGLKFYENIIDFFNSIRSILAQNALILMNEVFSQFIPLEDTKNQKVPPVVNLIKKIVPILVLKANTSQSFIKNEAKTCLETIVNNMKYNDTLIILLHFMNTKKLAEMELLYVLTLKFIKICGKSFFENFTNFGGIVTELGQIYENNKTNLYKKKCKTIINSIIEIMTKEEFDKKCGKKEKEQIKIIMEDGLPANANTKKEIHNLVLKSKENNKKSCERSKTSCNTKPLLKKQIDFKNFESKIQQNQKRKQIDVKFVNSKIKQKENSENINNNVADNNIKTINA